ncbi:UDP-N-acetyl-D-mannosamine dehydrogenase [Thalassospira sp. TSL5-1]|uniref:UDP-N-acetyl-D-mannosamine dehydrogenase n=1 Tax=Thalassospira sp. TSL5-1 TaxID=1544451 RepID=UPI00093AEF54|nr:UDP-N-acetyl-D-mannosamine dehydrogenase [Thalassospira sp. TSL5-1]
MQFNTVSVIGLGYIGLPTAAVFASRKIRVIGVDVNQNAVDTINRGEIHIVEPDLDMVVHAAVTEGYLRATTLPEPADAFLIAVPTPFKGDNHEPDLSYIEAATKAIAPVLMPGNLVILESTSPVGTTEKIAQWLAEARPDLTFPQSQGENSDIRIAHCPERVLPGQVLHELVRNDRVVGGMTPKCSALACALYKTFVQGECVVTNARTAEMAKLTENSFRDVNIAFANELSMICDKLDINVWELISLANRHPRVNILQPGPGVGGHCIAVDPWFIVHSAPSESKLIETARRVNDGKKEWVSKDIIRTIKVYLKTKKINDHKKITISFLGITFKPNIDDLRESPPLEIIKKVSENFDGTIKVVDPNISNEKNPFNTSTLTDAIKNSDIIIELVNHREFSEIITKPQTKFKSYCRHINKINEKK